MLVLIQRQQSFRMKAMLSLAERLTTAPHRLEDTRITGNCPFDNSIGYLWDTALLSGLTHWGRVTYICVSKLTIIVSDNGLSPGRRQAIIWNNDGILLIWPLGTNFGEILIEIRIFSFKKMYLKVSSGKWRPFCLGLNVLTWCNWLHLLQ